MSPPMHPLRWQKHGECGEEPAGATPTSARRVRFDDDALCTYQEAPVYDTSDEDADADAPRRLRRVNAELFGATLRAHTSGGWDGEDVEMMSVEDYFYIGEDDYTCPESPASSTGSSTPATPVDDLPELIPEDVSDRLAQFSLEDPAAGSYMPYITTAGPTPLSEDSQLLFADIDSTMRELVGGFKALTSPLDGFDEHAPPAPTSGPSRARTPPMTPLRIAKGWSNITHRGPSTLPARADRRVFASRHSRSAILGAQPEPSLLDISLSDSEDEDEPVRPFSTRGGQRAVRRVPTQKRITLADSEFDALGLWAPPSASGPAGM
ncbi:hypothetical protein PsYK624_012920 [Phanerochaete sordida]|uniref:Uncharacterized protein n=1 Tax=Phanerochaete sordida TaxID=48140 RepID=A0A9P3FZL5_9APHY|nr:hypothetical protein PsYK624_012920 [Phanerochaete sordida]